MLQRCHNSVVQLTLTVLHLSFAYTKAYTSSALQVEPPSTASSELPVRRTFDKWTDEAVQKRSRMLREIDEHAMEL